MILVEPVLNDGQPAVCLSVGNDEDGWFSQEVPPEEALALGLAVLRAAHRATDLGAVWANLGPDAPGRPVPDGATRSAAVDAVMWLMRDTDDGSRQAGS